MTLKGYDMKKLFVILAIIVLLFARCSMNTANESVGDPQIDPDLMTVTVTESSGISAAIEMTNNSDMVMLYGEPYILEYFEKGEWIEAEERNETMFNLIAYEIKPGETAKWAADFEYRYGVLPNGIYRIVKEIDFLNESGEICGNMQITAEFKVVTIEK